MRFEECSIPGCWVITPAILADARGRFVKTFRSDAFAERGLVGAHAEEYFTLSRRGVLRGLHFQVPPHEYAKLVCCVSGEAFDAILDLRAGSPTYGRHETFVLSGDGMRTLYLPPGIAHGFYVTGNHAILHYTVSAVHAPEYDRGVLWNSAGIRWPDPKPVVSERDARHPPLSAFQTPFASHEFGRDR